MKECAPTSAALRYLKATFPQLDPPYHLLVHDRSQRRNIPGAIVHACSQAIPAGAFVRVANGIYVCSPELCFIQIASQLPLLRTVSEGHALCGIYRLGLEGEGELLRRESICSVGSMASFARSNQGLSGAALAMKALGHVRDRSASPRETQLSMRLTLPVRLGGFGLPAAELNRQIDMGRRASGLTDRSFYVADMCWPSAKLIVEYDSDLHLTSAGLAHDAKKRAALVADGYMVVTVTRLQLDDPVELKCVATQIARRLGKRIRLQAKTFEKRQKALFMLDR